MCDCEIGYRLACALLQENRNILRFKTSMSLLYLVKDRHKIANDQSHCLKKKITSVIENEWLIW